MDTAGYGQHIAWTQGFVCGDSVHEIVEVGSYEVHIHGLNVVVVLQLYNRPPKEDRSEGFLSIFYIFLDFLWFFFKHIIL